MLVVESRDTFHAKLTSIEFGISTRSTQTDLVPVAENKCLQTASAPG